MNGLEHFRLLHPGWRDLIEVALVSFVLYRVLLLFQYGAIALLIVFHPELRAALAHLGRTRRLFPPLGDERVADEIAKAAERMSRLGIGAIVAIERHVRLDEYIATGVDIQARANADLLVTMFTPHAPLHDGAVIIRGDTIVAAGCILPLSQRSTIDRSHGTRHRAAVGLTEETDALVVVVSEETSSISLAAHTQLWRNLTPAQLRQKIIGPLDRPSEATQVGISA
jgi:diadenylate cyclase